MAELPRRTPLARRTPLKPGAPLKRTRLGRNAGFPGREVRTRSRGPNSRAWAKADRLFSLRIRARDKTCQFRVSSRCTGVAEQCCHLIPRGSKRVRCDDDNAVGGCASCHGYYTNREAAFELWKIEHLGMERYYAMLRYAVPKGPVDPVPVVERLTRGERAQNWEEAFRGGQ